MAGVLHDAAARSRRIQLMGHGSKRLMAGPLDPEASLAVSATRLDRLLAYEPRDLTVSVEAGMPFARLQKLLAANRQMIPLDPMFPAQSTVGGIVAANISGPRRRQYGTARDLVIGMQFATLQGRLVDSGGMVVKNVAGLDMAKLMIGSFGTLAVITVVNFKLLPMPAAERTFTLEFASLPDALAARDALLRGAVQPGAIDLVNPVLAAEHGLHNWNLLLWFGGNDALMRRCERELALLGSPRPRDPSFWDIVHDLTPRFTRKFAGGAVVRISCRLQEIGTVFGELDVPAIARVGVGIVYAYFNRSEAAATWVRQAAARKRHALIEFAPDAVRSTLDLWPEPGPDFAIMKKIKHLFDPDQLLNRGRLYRHL